MTPAQIRRGLAALLACVGVGACGSEASDPWSTSLGMGFDTDATWFDDAEASGENDDAASTGAAGEVGATMDGDETGAPSGTQCSPMYPTSTFGEPGPFAVTRSLEGPLCTIYRPELLGAQGPHPVIVWGNGTGAIPLIYDGVLSHWASHGFVVAAADTPLSGSGLQMLACLDYLEAEATTSGSVYEGMLDLDRVAAAGHSQGGGGALMLGQDPRVVTTAPVEPFTMPAFGGYDPGAQGRQSGPMFLMSGSLDAIAPSVPHQWVVWETANVPVLWGLKRDVSHIVGVIGAMDAFRREITAWMRYQLMCDEEAAALFVDECTLCSDPAWTVQSAL